MTNLTSLISVGEHAFKVDGRPIGLYGGAAHYWRLDRDKWDDILDKVKTMGFTTISIYVPWEIHEVERGKFDFGEIDPRKDIDAYLSLIESKGMRIVVRPGPQINSELTWFGYPLRILADPELQALNGQGTRAVLTQAPRPIPAVSYAADKFYDETAIWYDAICPILAKHVYPAGGLVAAQVDNEMAFFFHVNAYASDFSAASIAAYRRYLEDTHGTIGELNDRYGSSHASFDEIDPPRRFSARGKEDIPYHTDWVTYRERYLIDSMDRLAKMMRERGLADVPLFHNYPHPLGPGGAVSGFTTPFNLAELEEKLAFVGFDIYSRKELYEHVKTIVSYVVGTSRFPYIPEFIAGVWPWYLNPGELADEEFVTKAALMHGIKGFSRYMLVERDRWLDSPIRRDGRVREDHADMFGSVNRLLTENSFADLRRRADVLLLANRDYDRLEAASVLVSFPGDFLETPSGFSEYPSFMTVSEETLGFAEPIQVAKTDRFWSSYRGLTEAGIAFLLSDTALAPERWRAYGAIVVGTYEYISTELQHRLIEYARAGGVLVMGPRLPSLDDRMRQDDTLLRALEAGDAQEIALGGNVIGWRRSLGSGTVALIEDLSDPAGALAAALEGVSVTRWHRNDMRLDVAIHESKSDSGQRIVFVANPTAEAIDAEIGLDGGVPSAHELWDDRPVTPSGGVLRDRMEPYTIKIYACAR
jgi:beta-galactosidase